MFPGHGPVEAEAGPVEPLRFLGVGSQAEVGDGIVDHRSAVDCLPLHPFPERFSVMVEAVHGSLPVVSQHSRNGPQPVRPRTGDTVRSLEGDPGLLSFRGEIHKETLGAEILLVQVVAVLHVLPARPFPFLDAGQPEKRPNPFVSARNDGKGSRMTCGADWSHLY